jgi:hypothetical protein
MWVQASNDWFISSSLEYTKPVVNPPYFKDVTAISRSNPTDFAAELDHSGRQGIFATGTYNDDDDDDDDDDDAILAEIFDLTNTTAMPLRDIVNISF